MINLRFSATVTLLLLMTACNSTNNYNANSANEQWARYNEQKSYVEQKRQQRSITAAQAVRLKQIAFNTIIGETPITEAYWAKAMLVAEKLDNKQISQSEALAMDKQLWAQAETQIKHMQVLDSQLQANNSQTNANNVASGTMAMGMMQRNNLMQQQSASSYSTNATTNMPTTTNCYGYGNNINCSSRRQNAIPYTTAPGMPQF